MDTPRMLMLAIVAIGMFYVVLPIMMFAYLNVRGRRTVACPETGLAEEIELDAWHAAVTAVPGPPRLHVASCTRWPLRTRCAEGCLSEPAARHATAAS
jgi:hypothetical protein